MHRRIFQTIAVGCLALTMCVATLVLLQNTAVIPQPSLASRLPGSGTVVFFQHVTMQRLPTVSTLLRLETKLSSPLPVFGSGSYELAIVERGDAWHWVLQQTTHNNTELSGPAASWLIADTADHSIALNRMPAFRRMNKATTPTLWLRTDVIPFSESRSDIMFRAILAPYSHALFTWSQPSMLTLLRSKQQAVSSRRIESIESAQRDGLSLFDPALGTRIAMIMDTVRTNAPALHEGIVGIAAHTWQQAFGTTLDGTNGAKHLTGMHVEYGSGAKLVVALSFEGLQKEAANDLLESFAARLPQTGIRNLELPHNSRIDMSIDPEAVQQSEEVVVGWRLRTVTSRNGVQALVLAERGTSTLLSTNVDLLRRMIADATFSGSAALPAGGSFGANILEKVIMTTLPIFAKEKESAFWRFVDAFGNVRWSLSTQVDADVMTIKESSSVSSIE